MRRLALLVCCLAIPAMVGATVLVPIDFRDLVTTSSVIVHGRVTDVHADWIEGRRAIQTFVTVEASEYLKGDLGHAVTFAVPGGRIGRYLTVFVGAPVFHVDDEVVLFLKVTGASRPVLLGLSQGVLRVRDGVDGQREVVAPVTIDEPAMDDRTPARRAIARRPVGLDRFRVAVRRALATAGRP